MLIRRLIFLSLVIESLSIQHFSLNAFLKPASLEEEKNCKDGVCTIDFNKNAPDLLEKEITMDLGSHQDDTTNLEHNHEESNHDDHNISSSFTSSESAESVEAVESVQSIDAVESAVKESAETSSNQVTDENESSPTSDTDNKISDEDLLPNIEELVKLGWKADDAKRALLSTNNDLETAVNVLEHEEDRNELILQNSIIIEKYGWKKDAAKAALLQTENNITAAIMLLESEENIICENFEASVKDMVNSGWDELVARQALMTQYAIDERKQAGQNVSVSEETLKSIHPTLKIENTTATTTDKAATNSKAKKAKKSAATPASTTTTSTSKKQDKPAKAKKEDCVYEITDTNFQKLVMESPIPVLLDIYADWCGPCKQLGPILEEAAMNTGGMFRLCKVNTEQQKSIAQALNVHSLPTVYAINHGKITDRFLGMVPTEQLQQFLVRAITGHGNRIQKDISDKELADLTSKMTFMAGLSSLTFRKKEILHKYINEVMNEEDAYVEGSKSHDLSDSMRTAIIYIRNAAKDIFNPRVRRISTSSKAYQDKLYGKTAALKLLDIAGFKPCNITTSANITNPDTTTTIIDHTSGGTEPTIAIVVNSNDNPQYLRLAHKNAALLSLVIQKVEEILKAKKFNDIKLPSKHTSSSSDSSSHHHNNNHDHNDKDDKEEKHDSITHNNDNDDNDDEDH